MTIHSGGFAEYVGLTVQFAEIASSSGSLRLKLMTENEARSPWLPATVMSPSIAANSIGVLAKNAVWIAVNPASDDLAQQHFCP